MLDETGRPDERLFADDLVHLNDEGYSVLADRVRDALAEAERAR